MASTSERKGIAMRSVIEALIAIPVCVVTIICLFSADPGEMGDFEFTCPGK
jgi:hypothetical protein